MCVCVCVCVCVIPCVRVLFACSASESYVCPPRVYKVVDRSRRVRIYDSNPASRQIIVFVATWHVKIHVS